jgi:hypothetical protein
MQPIYIEVFGRYKRMREAMRIGIRILRIGTGAVGRPEARRLSTGGGPVVLRGCEPDQMRLWSSFWIRAMVGGATVLLMIGFT